MLERTSSDRREFPRAPVRRRIEAARYFGDLSVRCAAARFGDGAEASDDLSESRAVTGGGPTGSAMGGGSDAGGYGISPHPPHTPVMEATKIPEMASLVIVRIVIMILLTTSWGGLGSWSRQAFRWAP
jgi:hypothetical protein